MKLFCLSDIHGDFGIITRAKRWTDDYDLILISGDITHFNSKMVAEKMVESLKTLGRILLVPGNCDLPETHMVFEDEAVSLHGQGRVIEDIGFFGVGGSPITPFDTPFEISEDAISNLLNEGYKEIIGCKKKIMVSHPPPYGTEVDKTKDGKHGGSKAVYDFIKNFDIDMVLCGHIHEARGEDRINDTLVINNGSGHLGFVSVDFDDALDYDFVNF